MSIGQPCMVLGVELRQTSPGAYQHPPIPDHYIYVHAGTPVRTSCHGGRELSVRTPGDVNVIPAGTADEWIDDDAGASLDLRLPSSLVRRVAEDMGLDPDSGIEPRYHFKDPQVEHIAWALEFESRAGFPSGSLYAESLGVALGVHLLSRYRAPARPRGGLSRRQMQRVVEHVEKHLDGDLSLLRLARLAEVSTSHFKTLFKRSMGVTVHEYVIQRRVERAKALLARGELPPSQVALEVGFAHQSHMARWMRRLLGVTPATLVRSRG